MKHASLGELQFSPGSVAWESSTAYEITDYPSIGAHP